jgi:hypothetical protein
MHRLIIFALFLSLGSLGLLAQDDNPIVLVASQGKMSYKAPGYSSSKLSLAAVLKPAGTLSLKAKSSATLFADGAFKTIQGPTSLSLSTAFAANGSVKINFERGFTQYLYAALDLAANSQGSKDAWGTVTGKKGSGDGWGTVTGKKGSGDGWGTVTGKKGSGDGWGTVTGKKGSGDGWGGKGKLINGIAPFGKIRPGAKVFKWSKPSGAQRFKLEIKNSKGELIQQAETADTMLSAQLDPAKFQEGQQYQWTVSTSTGEIQSSPLLFEIGTAAAQTAARQRAENAESYPQVPAAMQGLMRAIALEQGEWHEDAAQTYREVQSTNPNNLLVQLMHAAFWMRNGPKPMAELAFKQP